MLWIMFLHVNEVCELFFCLVAATSNDPLVKQLFYDVGEQLGRHVMALVPKIDQVVSIIHVNVLT